MTNMAVSYARHARVHRISIQHGLRFSLSLQNFSEPFFHNQNLSTKFSLFTPFSTKKITCILWINHFSLPLTFYFWRIFSVYSFYLSIEGKWTIRGQEQEEVLQAQPLLPSLHILSISSPFFNNKSGMILLLNSLLSLIDILRLWIWWVWVLERRSRG